MQQTLFCASCGSDDLLALSDAFLCLTCRHEGTPSETAPTSEHEATPGESAPTTQPEVDAILHAESVAEVLAGPDVGESAPTTPLDVMGPAGAANYAGRFVRTLDSDDVLLCTEDDGVSRMVQCVHENGREVERGRSQLVLADDPADVRSYELGDGTVLDTQPYEPTIFAVAALAITQGLACIPDDGTGELLNPRIGWLPPPCNELPEVEQGIAYAIAVLITTYQLDRSSVEQIAATLLTGAQAPEGETEQ